MSFRKKYWSISQPELTVKDGLYRVEAEVEGKTVWFESASPLEPAAEAFTAAFFLPALHFNKKLHVAASLDSQWLDRTRQLLPVLHEWWGYPLQTPVETMSDLRSSQASAASVTNGRTGLCFTCGADSFYSLSHHQPAPTDLIFAHGYDIPVDDTKRAQKLQTSLQQVAQERGVGLHIVRTNLRTHPLFKKVNWGRTHGAALSALGQLLRGKISRLVIASSYPRHRGRPWGSSWLLDQHWSSSMIEIEHDDASVSRWEKLVKISNDPLPQQHLQVCWSLKSETGNCGVCEKCLRTMVVLEIADSLPQFTTFPQETALPDLMDRLKTLPEHLWGTWIELRDVSPSAETRAAIDRLMERSRPATSWWRKLAG